MADTKKALKLGQFAFLVKHCKPDFIEELYKIIPPLETECDEIELLDMSCTSEPRTLFNHVLKKHYKYLWIQAASLVSPTGKKVLISGPETSGKTSFAVGLTMGCGWSLLSEDVTLIDPTTNQIISFAAPFSIKRDVAMMLKNTIGQTPELTVLDQWVAASPFMSPQDECAPFDAAIFLEPVDFDLPISAIPLAVNAFCRKILPISNVGRKKGGENMEAYLPDGNCFQVSGGKLQERLEFIHNLCAEKWSLTVPLKASSSSGIHSPKIAFTVNFKRAEHLNTAVLPDGSCVVVSTNDDWAMTLSPMAAIIWEFCDGLHTTDQILQELSNLELSSEVEKHQVVDLLKEFVDAGLVSEKPHSNDYKTGSVQ